MNYIWLLKFSVCDFFPFNSYFGKSKQFKAQKVKECEKFIQF